MHDRPERAPASHWESIEWVADPHFMRKGEPKYLPSYRVGDLLVVYLSGRDRCPAIVEVTAIAAFDPERVGAEVLGLGQRMLGSKMGADGLAPVAHATRIRARTSARWARG